jgi:hypothetical protein
MVKVKSIKLKVKKLNNFIHSERKNYANTYKKLESKKKQIRNFLKRN